MKPHLQDIATSIYRFCLEQNMSLKVQWIYRDLNIRADYLCDITDKYDWGIAIKIFNELDRAWGPHTIDRFTSDYNKKTLRYNSRCWNPGAKNIDAFCQNWTRENNWIVPPIQLISRVIHHIFMDRANSTLIVPLWPSSKYWPLLYNYYNCCKTVIISGSKDNFVPSRIPNGMFGEKDLSFNMIAIRLEFDLQ